METTTHNKRKVILIGLSVLGTGVAGFLGWNYWKNKKKAAQEEDNTTFTDSSNTTALPPASNDEFPLKKGSKGNKVTQLQNALVKKFGASALPKYGVDGMFGSEVEAALVRAKLPTSVDATTFIKLVGGLNGLDGIPQGEEIISTCDCHIHKCRGDEKLKMPKHIVLGEKEFTMQGWIHFTPKNSTEQFRVRQENVKSFNEFKNEKS
jgi:hypothetical protein